ncbi:TSUP family transporter [Rhodococcus hoagii]|nr:TSUP family transporter [Prescottella equi]
MAGGIFLVPLLTTVAHLSFGAAVAISLVSVVACSCASSPTLLVKRLTNIRLAIVLEIAASLGALVGLLAVGAISERILYGLFAAVLVVSAAQMLKSRRPRSAPTHLAPTSWATQLRLHSSFPGPQRVETPYIVHGPVQVWRPCSVRECSPRCSASAAGFSRSLRWTWRCGYRSRCRRRPRIS